jgi:Fe-S-cluster containining protein
VGQYKKPDPPVENVEMPKLSLPVLANAAEATFDCIFGRGCEGICCKNGRPSVDQAEQKAIGNVISRVLPHLRPEARKLVETEGFLSKRTKLGAPMLRVVDGWCVFFNKGCTLHKVGIADGDAYQYKPIQCALFPLEKGDDGVWFVRQWGIRGEKWDLFCLNPKESDKLATDSLASELSLAAKCDAKTNGSKDANSKKRSLKRVRLKRRN